MKKFVYPLLFGMLLLPLFSFFHECGHYMAGVALNTNPQLHWAHVLTPNYDRRTPVARFCVDAGGPLIDALCVVGGLLWLRRSRVGKIPAKTDWLAVALVQRAIAPILGFVLLVAGSLTVPDEATMSVLLGLSKWTLPSIVSLLGLSALVAALRLLPRGYRLLPFVCMHLGGLIGSLCVVAYFHFQHRLEQG